MPPTNHWAKGRSQLEGLVEVAEPAEQLAGLAGPEGHVVGVGLVVERAVGDQGLGRNWADGAKVRLSSR